MIFQKRKKFVYSKRKTEENGNFYSSTLYNRASLNLEIIQIVYNFQVNTHLVNVEEWTAIVADTLWVVFYSQASAKLDSLANREQQEGRETEKEKKYVKKVLEPPCAR